MFGTRVGKGAEQDLSVIFRDDAAVQEHDGTVIGLCSDEPPEALAEPQRRLRQLELHEGVLVTLGPSLYERIVGHAERKPGDHDAAEDVAGQVDACPEGLRAEQHGPALREALEERAARAVDALRQDREALSFERAEARRRIAQARV